VYTQQLRFGVYGNLLRRSITVLADYRVQFQTAGLKAHPPSANSRLGEAGSGRLLQPSHELTQRHVIPMLRVHRLNQIRRRKPAKSFDLYSAYAGN
jgi:hypothetical protein